MRQSYYKQRMIEEELDIKDMNDMRMIMISQKRAFGITFEALNFDTTEPTIIIRLLTARN